MPGFDRLSVGAMVDLELPKAELQAALDGLPADKRQALEAAAATWLREAAILAEVA